MRAQSQVWCPYSTAYIQPEMYDYDSKTCPRCDERRSIHDSHGIEDCIRSLADRVKLILTQEK